MWKKGRADKKQSKRNLILKENEIPMTDTREETGADEETLYRLAELFKVFGEPTRIRILWVLSREEMCVQDIANALSMTSSAISHQLRILKQSALVKARRDGKTIVYSLADDHVSTIMAQGLEHVLE